VTLTAVWLVLVLLASWASTARADDVTPVGGTALDTPSDPPPAPPGPADGTGPTGGGTPDPGTSPSAGDTSTTPPPSPPTDPPPAQDTGQPVDSSGTTPPPDTSAGGTPGSPADTTAGTDSTPGSTDTGSSDPKKTSPSKSGTDSTAAAPSGSSDQFSGPPPVSTTPSALELSGAPGDEMWVDQWSAFTRADPVVMLRQSFKPGIRFARGGSFVLFGTSKAKQLEARARQEGDTAKASPLGGSGVLHSVPGSGAGLFDLLSGNGSGGGVLMIFGFLGILAITLLPMPSRTRALRLPTVTWRPSAYVPPIEQPG
jgi:hypothetical protein